MNSSELLLIFLVGGLGLWVAIFIIWELIEAARPGKETLTTSQRIIKMAKSGNLWARIYILALPVFLILIGVWLMFHFESLCINFNILCGIDW